MYCKNCGKELKEESSFCSNCGFPINGNIDMRTEEFPDANADSVKSDLSLISSEAESMKEQKEKWSTADIIGAIFGGIPAIILTIILVKFWILPTLSDDTGLITFLPYCLLCLFLSVSIVGIPLSIIMIIYYGVKNDYKKVKGELIGLAICPVLGVVSFICLINCNLTDKIQKWEKPNKAVKMRAKCGNLRYIAEYPVG